ncbi:MAG: PEP-CTERM sorting domain-containing protein [Planctomycetota bacterium]|nr:MAG: PEP-CTERM sorting domain-containing protein [Planctomycetota bacterium]
MQNRATTISLTLALLAGSAAANPVNGNYVDVPMCDSHGNLIAIEELGEGPLFPTDELISTVWTTTNQSACVMSDDPNMPNVLVEMTNLSGRYWNNLFYVADLDTSISNVDGLADSAAAPGAVGEAFRIDALGSNRNLLVESIAVDGIFEPGEIWAFIIQDYANAAGLPPSFGSLDFAGGSSFGPDSTGSIVQFVVPAPGSLALLGFGGMACIKRRR